MFDLVSLPEEEETIKNNVKGNVVTLSKDPQGNHVI
jgi:hypothetical protein